MNIRLAGNTDAAQWDAFVERHPDASPYHLWAWKEAVERAYSHKGYYLLAEDYGEIIGVFPLIKMQILFLSNQLVSLPFCDIGGCLANSPETETLLINEAIRVGAELKVNSIDIRTNTPQIRTANRQTTVSSEKVRMLLDLPHESEILWKKFKSKLRSQISRSTKNGLLFSWGNQDCMNQFYNVFSANMRDLGSPVHAKCWIQAVLDHYGDTARMGLIHKEGTTIGCGIILMTSKRICIPWASTLREYNNLSPNMLLYWSFLEYAADSGHDRFDFGRSTPGEGTYKFKAQWGAEPQKLYWHTVYLGCPPPKESESEACKAYGKRERLASLWARLPLWAANSLGPHLRRHINL